MAFDYTAVLHKDYRHIGFVFFFKLSLQVLKIKASEI